MTYYRGRSRGQFRKGLHTLGFALTVDTKTYLHNMSAVFAPPTSGRVRRYKGLWCVGSISGTGQTERLYVGHMGLLRWPQQETPGTVDPDDPRYLNPKPFVSGQYGTAFEWYLKAINLTAEDNLYFHIYADHYNSPATCPVVTSWKYAYDED